MLAMDIGFSWTDATARWWAGFSNAVMFLGVCRVHRAQLLQVRGEWARAETEIVLVCSELAEMNVIAVGLALYELGEIRRLRGDFDGAEEAYAEAHRHGRDPQPGLALLWSAADGIARHSTPCRLPRRPRRNASPRRSCGRPSSTSRWRRVTSESPVGRATSSRRQPRRTPALIDVRRS